LSLKNTAIDDLGVRKPAEKKSCKEKGGTGENTAFKEKDRVTKGGVKRIQARYIKKTTGKSLGE